MNQFDFSKAKVKLVGSVPGYFHGEKYGHLRLRQLLKGIKIEDHNAPIEYQASSVGNIEANWLEEFLFSLTGTNQAIKVPFNSEVGPLTHPPFRIIYPSAITAIQSLEHTLATIAVKYSDNSKKYHQIKIIT